MAFSICLIHLFFFLLESSKQIIEEHQSTKLSMHIISFYSTPNKTLHLLFFNQDECKSLICNNITFRMTLQSYSFNAS